MAYVRDRYREIPVSATAGEEAVGIAPHGVTELGSSAATYVLGAPRLGYRKTIYCTSTSSDSRIVRGSTGTSVTFNNQGATQLSFSSTGDKCIDLLGVSSVRWLQLSNVGSVTLGTT